MELKTKKMKHKPLIKRQTAKKTTDQYVIDRLHSLTIMIMMTFFS